MTYKLPIAADDVEFEREFGTNTKCIEALFNARWPDGFICPKCAHGACWRRHTRPGIIECQGCHFETTVTAARYSMLQNFRYFCFSKSSI